MYIRRSSDLQYKQKIPLIGAKRKNDVDDYLDKISTDCGKPPTIDKMRLRNLISWQVFGWYCPAPHYVYSIVKNELRSYVCLFVCLWFFVPGEKFSLILRHDFYRWRPENCDLCATLMDNEQWGFFRVPNLLWHSISVYNGHIREPVTLTPVAERLAGKLSLHIIVFTTYVCHGRDSNTQPSACRANALTDCASAAFQKD